MLLNQQFQGIEMAVASMDEYRIVSKYSHLSYEHNKWFKLSTKQQQAKLNQFMRHTIDQETASCSYGTQDESNPPADIGLPSYVTVHAKKWYKSAKIFFQDLCGFSTYRFLPVPTKNFARLAHSISEL